MKYISFSKLLLLGFSFVFMLASCTKEGPMGPAGADGQDGTNGINGTNGTNGVDGTAFCMECHSATVVDNLTAEWTVSGHGSGSSLGRGTRSGCSQCHSGVGFVASLSGSEDLSGSSIKCSSCHTHGEPPVFQDEDGNPVFVRTKDAVALMIDPSTIIDLESAANLCVNCHQPRTAAPVDEDQYDEDDVIIDPAGDGMYTITSSHYGPHHSPQSALLEGWGGYEFPGSVTYPGTKAHPHRKSADCIKCHMHEKNHKFTIPEVTACASCHGDIDDYNVNGKVTEIHGLIEELAGLLEEEGILHDGHVVTGTYPIKLAAAFFNYAIIEEDQSEGVHNPIYVEALLTNTIEALQVDLAGN